MPLATVTVAGTITAPDGTPFARKTVWFTTTAEMVDAAGNVLYPITRIQARVITGQLKAADGTSPLVLVDSDAGLGTVPYVIEESWANGRKFERNLTAGMVVSGHIPYSTLGPVTPAPTATSPYALLSDVETRDTATLTAAEAYTDAHSGGGGAVASVFGRAGIVTAQSGDYTAAQVGADPAGAATTAFAAEATARANADAAEVIARNAAIAAAVAGLINGAPGALDTLKELADAINDDASFAASVTTALAGKQPLDSDLTAIAALTTTAFGRAFLAMADAAATKTALSLVKGDVGLGNVDNTADAAKTFAESQVTGLTTDLAAKAPIAGPFAPSSTGATAAGGYAGVTTSGPPTSGSWTAGQWVSDHDGNFWTCTASGPPGTWVQSIGAGQVLAGPVQWPTASGTLDFFSLATGASWTDITTPVALSLAVPASSSRPVIVRAMYEVNANAGTAVATTVPVFAQLRLVDSTAATIYSVGGVTFYSTGSAGVQKGRIVLEAYLAAPVSAVTLKIQGNINAAKPTNWTNCVLNPGYGIGGTDNFYAVAG